MSGGRIIEIIYGADFILLYVRGVGVYRDRTVEVALQPTNYRLRVGDLVWWSGSHVRWERITLARAIGLRESCEGQERF